MLHLDRGRDCARSVLSKSSKSNVLSEYDLQLILAQLPIAPSVAAVEVKVEVVKLYMANRG